jgi:hypothetical protein
MVAVYRSFRDNFTQAGDHLFAQPANQPMFQLFPESAPMTRDERQN